MCPLTFLCLPELFREDIEKFPFNELSTFDCFGTEGPNLGIDGNSSNDDDGGASPRRSFITSA